jgi:alkanesulfonate monooxygenase SsuD/methylene tetrahydromethanopterin reductase-like flavin-dependent oxidoreductase (luciferase family)
MRLCVVLSDGHAATADPAAALAQDRKLVAQLRGRVDGIVLSQGWGTAPSWSLQALTYGAFLAEEAEPLRLTLRGLPLDVVNPIEVAEQISTVEHAWQGRLAVSVRLASPEERSSFGIADDPGARFEEALFLISRMWAVEPFHGDGPIFVFDRVRPTLAPFREGGTPLALDVEEVNGAALAGRLGLGLHLGAAVAPSARPELIGAYRDEGGVGELSVEVHQDELSVAALQALAGEGFAQADIRVRTPGEDAAIVVRRVDELAALAGSLHA